MPQPLRLGAVYDFRNPPESGMRTPDFYAAIMDQVSWLDQLGLDLIWFTEHHFVDDGYLPSWIPVASAMAARTRHARFSCDVCLLPFNHPIRLAEDLAVLDNLSNGRVEIGEPGGSFRCQFATARPAGSGAGSVARRADGVGTRSGALSCRYHPAMPGDGRPGPRLADRSRRGTAADGGLQQVPRGSRRARRCRRDRAGGAHSADLGGG